MESKDLEELYVRQMADFPLARANYGALAEVCWREVRFPGFRVRVQYNPGRMVSTAAKTDRESLQRRACFLCPANMPAEQEGLAYGERYRVCLNPYPIFTRHFTVPSVAHEPQRMAGRLADMLALAEDFRAYTVFYNGPASGASAPDHFHFQLVPRRVMPLEEETGGTLRETLAEGREYTAGRLRDYLREALVLESADRGLLLRLTEEVIAILGEVVEHEEEPRFNLFAWREGERWTVCVLPRRRWRPRQFFLEGEERVTFSPGCADMAGLVIAPRREDFERYTPELLEDLFGQVTVTPAQGEEIARRVRAMNVG